MSMRCDLCLEFLSAEQGPACPGCGATLQWTPKPGTMREPRAATRAEEGLARAATHHALTAFRDVFGRDPAEMADVRAVMRELFAERFGDDRADFALVSWLSGVASACEAVDAITTRKVDRIAVRLFAALNEHAVFRAMSIELGDA